MKTCLAFLLLVVFCTGIVMAAYPCSSNICNEPECQSGQTGNLLFSTQNGYFYTNPPQLFIDGTLTSVKTWSPAPNTPPYSIYTFLPAGTYTFTLKAQNYTTMSDSVTICAKKLTTIAYNPSYSTTQYVTFSKIGTLSTLAPVSATTTTAAPVTTTATQTAVVTASIAANTAVETPSVTALVTSAGTSGLQVEASGTGPGIASPSATSSSGNVATAATGSLSVVTNPGGAAIYLDGVQRGITPATIPGLTPGDHTLLLKLNGYADLSTPVTIIAGETQTYTTSLAKSGAAPGFGFLAGIAALAAIICLRRS